MKLGLEAGAGVRNQAMEQGWGRTGTRQALERLQFSISVEQLLGSRAGLVTSLSPSESLADPGVQLAGPRLSCRP